MASGNKRAACSNTASTVAKLGAVTIMDCFPCRIKSAAAIPKTADLPRPRSDDSTKGRRRCP